MTVVRYDQRADRGLARERTVLAWNRSGLALVVCVAVLLRHLWPLQGDDRFLAVGLVAAAAIVWALVTLVVSHNRRTRGDTLPRGARALGLITAATVVLALGAVTLGLVTPG